MFELSTEARITHPYKVDLRRGAGRATALVAPTAQLQPKTKQILLTGQAVRTRIARVQYNPHKMGTMLLSAEVAQKYLKGNYWLSCEPETFGNQTLSVDGTLKRVKMVQRSGSRFVAQRFDSVPIRGSSNFAYKRRNSMPTLAGVSNFV